MGRKKYFLNNDIYEDRYMELNPKDFISNELKHFLSTIPKDEATKYTLLGDEHYKKGEYEEAIENYNHALELDLNNLSALYYRGLCLIKIKMFEASIEDFTRLIQLKPDFIQSYFYRGNAELLIHTYVQIKKAIDDYTIVINHDPANGGAFFARGYCFLLLKQEYPAFLDWKKAKELGIAKEIAANWEKDYFE